MINAPFATALSAVCLGHRLFGTLCIDLDVTYFHFRIFLCILLEHFALSRDLEVVHFHFHLFCGCICKTHIIIILVALVAKFVVAFVKPMCVCSSYKFYLYL